MHVRPPQLYLSLQLLISRLLLKTRKILRALYIYNSHACQTVRLTFCLSPKNARSYHGKLHTRILVNRSQNTTPHLRHLNYIIMGRRKRSVVGSPFGPLFCSISPSLRWIYPTILEAGTLLTGELWGLCNGRLALFG